MTIEQLPLFPGETPQGESGSHVARRPGLTAESSLGATIERFREHMVQRGYADNTVKSFLGDLRILKRYLKGDPPVRQIST